MKKIIVTVIFFLLATNLYAQCEIRFRQIDFSPFHFKDSQGNWSGIFTEQAKAVVEEAGCQIVYRKSPWARALVLLEEGNVDMMGWMTILDERKKYLNFIGPHYHETQKLLVREDSDYQIQKHEDLKRLPMKIAAVRGSWYGEEMNQLFQNESFLQRMTFMQGGGTSVFEQIRFGRVSGYITMEVPAILKKIEYKGLKFHPFVIVSNPVYFGLSKKTVSPALVTKLSEALERVVKRGEFEKIINKYK